MYRELYLSVLIQFSFDMDTKIHGCSRLCSDNIVAFSAGLDVLGKPKAGSNMTCVYRLIRQSRG